MARYDDDAPGGNALPWFLFGLGLGAALGLLFAPQAGADTRRAIGKKVRKLKELAEDRFDETMDTAGKKVRKLRENLAEVAEEFEDDDEEFEPRPSRAREELERRLAAARARRRGGPAPVAATADDEEPGA